MHNGCAIQDVRFNPCMSAWAVVFGADMTALSNTSSDRQAQDLPSRRATVLPLIPPASAMPTPSETATHSAPSASRTLLALVVALFFFWGAVTSLNDVLIPKFKSLFQLSYAEAMLTQFAFFAGYLAFSVPAGALIAKIGYLRGLVTGLAVMAFGCLLFWPATLSGVYASFLLALFVVAAGITILQVAANPLITLLGDPRSAHSRLTFSQAFNSLGTTLAPFIGAQLMLTSAAVSVPGDAAQFALFQHSEAQIVWHTYLALALLLALVALVFWRWRRALDGGNHAEHTGLAGSFSLLRQPRLGFGVAAIFFYVGAEVAIGSVLINYLSQPGVLGLNEQSAGERVSLYWGGAMAGRFVGAWILQRFSPGKVLACFALLAGLLAMTSSLSSGTLAGYSLIAVGLFNSIMFPTIFSLALEGLGERTPQGAGLLCMGIVGGALVPLLTGVVADRTNLGSALWVPVICYLLIVGFGWYARRPVNR